MIKIEKLKKIINESDNIVFFGGAGVSTESNIPDFRSKEGIYKVKQDFGMSLEEVVSHSFFVKNTNDFYKYYRKSFIHPEAKPNKAHIALANLEQKGKLKAIVTQNVDGLHQMAGSEKVLELHGSIHRNFCMSCKEFYDLAYILKEDNRSGYVPICQKCGGIVKPDVVLFEESLDDITVMESINAISRADTLIVGGTSLAVYPAASLISYFKGKNLVLINKEHIDKDKIATLVIYDKIGSVLDQV